MSRPKTDHHSLQFAAVFLVVAGAIVLAFFAFYLHQAAAVRRDIDRTLVSVAALRADEVAHWRNSHLAEGEILRRNREALDGLARGLAGGLPADVDPAWRHWLEAYVELLDYDSVLVLDARGAALLTVGRPHLPSAATGETIARARHNGAAELTAVQHGADGSAYVELVVPVPLGEARWTIDALVLRIDPARYLFPLLRRWPGASTSAETLLMREAQGMLAYLAPPRHAGAGRPLPTEARDDPRSAAAAALRGGPAAGLDYRHGPEVFAAAAPVPDSDWTLLSKIDEAEVLRENRRQLLAATAASLLLLLLSAVALGRVWDKQRGVAREHLESERRDRRELERLRSRLTDTMQVAKLGSWERNLLTGELWWSDEMRALLHIPADEAASLAGFARRVHPDDRERVVRELQVAYRNGQATELDYRVRFDDGRVRYVHNRISIDADEAGRPYRAVGTVQDVTDRHDVDQALRRQTAYLGAIINHLPEGISVFDEALRLQYWNARFGELLEIPAEVLRPGASFDDVVMAPARRGEYGSGDPRELVRRLRWQALQFRAERVERTRPNGHTHLVASEPLHIDGRIAGFITTYTDITARKETEEALASRNLILRTIIDNIPGGVSVFDADLRMVACNDELRRLLDLPPELFTGGLPSLETLFRFNAQRGEYGPGDHNQLVATRVARARQPYAHSFERVRPDGRVLYVQRQPLPDGGFVTIYTDLTERRRAEAAVEHLAHHDSLTGLANRFSLNARLEQAVAEARRNGHTLAVLFLDLDQFKHINDSHGHHAGDALLVEVAQRLRATVREVDTVARLGGDEFVVVLQCIAHATDAAHVAAKILQQLSAPYRVGECTLHTAPSIGISLFPDDGDEPTTLLRSADAAMYHAKAAGRANYQFYAADMNRSAATRRDNERKLREAIERGEFELWFQPQFGSAAGTLHGVEALVRWRHPEDGVIGPARFIPLAEESGLIVALGEWVLTEACRQARRWLDAGLAPLRVSVNLSARQLQDVRLADSVAAALAGARLPAAQLELEFSESSLMERPQAARAVLAELKALGVQLAVDDFGTARSSLSQLKRLPLDHLKIDRSFVSALDHDAQDAAVVAAAVSLAHNLGLSVIAEGVESAAQAERLKQMGCDEVQGFHFSKPLPTAAVEDLLRRVAVAA